MAGKIIKIQENTRFTKKYNIKWKRNCHLKSGIIKLKSNIIIGLETLSSITRRINTPLKMAAMAGTLGGAKHNNITCCINVFSYRTTVNPKRCQT